MKKELEDAKKFYKNIDEIVNDVGGFLEVTDCEEVKPKAEKVLNGHYSDTEDMIQEENIFRKQFSSSLKDKMSVLQKEAKDIKEARK